MSFKLITGALLAATAATATLAQVAPPPPAAPAPMAQQGWGKAQRSETRAEVVQHTQRLFARLDRNHDGVLTPDEIALAGAGGRGDRAGRAPGMAPPAPGGDRAQAMFDRVDANHDGVITRDEFAQAHAGMGAGGGHHMGRMAAAGAERGEHGGMRGRMLMMADTNRDGRITLEEMTAFALQRFDRMDLNHDGTVTPEERAQARAARGQSRG